LLTDQNCDVVENAIYTAFGEVSFKMDTVTNPFGFRGAMGYYLDSQTGDLYFSGRTAHPKIGRWLAIDPTTLAYGLDSQAIGPEAMTFVNALGRMDPRDKLPDRIDPTKPSDVNPKGEGGCTTEFHPRFRDSAKNPRKCPKDWTLVVDGVTDTRLRKPATQLWQCVKCSVEFCKEGCDRKVPCQLSGLTHEAGNIILKAQRCQCTSLRP
jgi:RHS repeat-associated protein